MILDTNLENLHFQLESKLLQKNDSTMKILLSNLKSETEKLSKQKIDKIPNIYIYYYSITKKWIIKRTQLKLQDNLKEIYTIFHSIISLSYILFKNKIQSILEKDNEIVNILLNDFDSEKIEDEVKKLVFDILIEVIKFQDLEKKNPEHFKKVVRFSFDNCIKGSFFNKKIASRFLIRSFEKMEENTHLVFEEKTNDFFATWFLKNNDFPAFLSLLFKTISYLKKDFKEKIIKNLLKIIKNKSSIETKTKIFLLLEKIFTETLFSNTLIEQVISNYIEFYEAQINIFLHEKLFFSFTQSYLQTILSFYNSSPNLAKKYIPPFISYILEFFGDNNYNKNYKENEKTNEMDIKYNNYKQLAINSFDILISTCFDVNLFKELKNENEAENEMMKLLMNNMSVNNNRLESLSEFGQKSIVSKIFVLFLHSLSVRFKRNFETINKILVLFFKQLRSLGLRESKIFNDYLICFYKASRESENQNEQTNLLFSEILMNVKLDYFLEKCFGIKNREEELNQYYSSLVFSVGNNVVGKEMEIETGIRNMVIKDQLGMSLLENSEFLFFFYIVEKYCGRLDFSAFFNYLRTVFLLTLDSINIQIKNSGTMGVEDINNPNLLNQKRFLKTFTRFSDFENLSLDSFSNYLSFLYVYSFEVDLPIQFRKYIMIMLQNFLIYIINNVKNPEFLKFLTKYSQKNLIFMKICKGLLTSTNPSIKQNFINLLKLFSRILDREYVLTLLTKNLTKLNRLLTGGNIDQNIITKSIKESEIIVEILSSVNDVHQFNNVFHQSINLSKNLLNLKKKESVKYGMKILEGLITNCHHNFYKQIETVFKIKLKNFLNSKNQNLDFNTHALKFLSILLNSIKLNSLRLKEKILEFADSYINFIIFNLKNRNGKNREFVKEILENIFNYFNEAENQEVIDCSNPLLARVIAGFAGDSDYIKSCTLEAIGFVYKKFYFLLSDELSQNFLEFAFLLLNEKKKEIFVSITKFFKYYFKFTRNEVLIGNLENILGMVYDIDKNNFQYFRNKLKTLLVILMKKYEREVLEEKLSGEWRKLYRNVFKTERQKVNKLQREKDEKKEIQKQSRKTQDTYIEKEEKKQKKPEKMEMETEAPKKQKLTKDDQEINQLIYDFENERYFFNTRGAKKKKRRREKKEIKNNGDVYYNKKTKKLIIKQQKSKQETGHKRTLEAFENENANQHVQKLKKKNQNKNAEVGTNMGARVLKRIKMTTLRRKDKVHFIQQSGDLYKNKFNGSDMKLVNKPDPHAFIQFNPVALSKKLRSKASKTFEVLMRKKKSGALKGMKVRHH